MGEIDLYGTLNVALISGRAWLSSSRWTSQSFTAQIQCMDKAWRSTPAHYNRPGSFQWNQSVSWKCTDGTPKELEIVLLAGGKLKKGDEVGRGTLDLRPTIANGQSTPTISLMKGGSLVGEVYLQLRFLPAAEAPVRHINPTTQLARSISHDPHPRWRCGQLWAGGQGLEALVQDLSSGSMYSPLGAGMTSPPPQPTPRPPSAPSAMPAHRVRASRPPVESEHRPPEHLNIAHRLCRPETAQQPLPRTASAPKMDSCKREADSSNLKAPETAASEPMKPSPSQELATALTRIHEQLHSTPEERGKLLFPTISYASESSAPPELPGTPCKEKEAPLISFGRWTYPKVDMASVEEGRAALGGLAGKRQKTRLEEETLMATSRVNSAPSAPPFSHNIMAMY